MALNYSRNYTERDVSQTRASTTRGARPCTCVPGQKLPRTLAVNTARIDLKIRSPFTWEYVVIFRRLPRLADVRVSTVVSGKARNKEHFRKSSPELSSHQVLFRRQRHRTGDCRKECPDLNVNSTRNPIVPYSSGEAKTCGCGGCGVRFTRACLHAHARMQLIRLVPTHWPRRLD